MHRLRNARNIQKSSSWNRQMILKKSLFALIALVTLQSIGVSAAPSQVLASNGNNNTIQSVICKTPGCIQAAANIMDFLDESVDPCDNFYEFACGNFLKKTQIPPEKTQVDTFSVISDSVKDQLKTILSEPSRSNESRAVVLAKNYYQSCMNQSIIEERGIKPLTDILNGFGGWPVVEGDSWSEGNFDWIEMLKKFRIRGFGRNYIFSFTVAVDYKNSTRRILEIDSANLALSRKYLIKGFEEKRVNSYLKLMIDIAIIFGADKERAKRELRESLEFEIELANITLSSEMRRKKTELYNPTTIKTLQKYYPYFDWLDFINAMLPQGLNVDENEVINNSDRKFFEQLGEVLNSTPKRTIANYLLWRAIYSITEYLTEQIRDVELQYDEVADGVMKREERWKECVSETDSRLSKATGELYVRKHFPEQSKKAVVEMVENIRNEFINILQNVSWMDDETRVKAIKKAELMTSHIGYPDELLDNNKIEEYYGNLEMETDNYLLNILRLSVFFVDRKFNQLRQPVNKTDWRTHTVATVVNAFYHSTENSIWFPAAILQERLFSADRPRYMNYATIGQAVGHETTHGFDDEGNQFDADGNLDEWWDPKTREQFLEKAKCIIEQYGKYTDLKTNLSLNGINTQGENIADNGGTKEAYNAYNNWVKRNGPEATLPGLKYNQQQLFWISSAQMWCVISTTEYLQSKILTDTHSPNEFRVNGYISNMHSFASDFKCSAGSKMNPEQKCQVW